MKLTLPRMLGPAFLVAAGLLAWWWLAPRTGSGPEKTPSHVASAPPVKKMKRLAMSAGTTLAPPSPVEQTNALDDLLADKPFVLVENGQPTRFQLSLQEVYVPGPVAAERVRTIDPQPNARSLIAQANQIAAGQAAGWVLYPEGAKHDPALRRILGTRLLLKVSSTETAQPLIARHGLRLIDRPSYAPGYLIAEAKQGGPAAALEAIRALSQEPSIESISPLLLHQPARKLVPNDPLYTQQWHLKNTGQGGGKAGTDINVITTWDTYQGQGIRIGIIDDGLDLLHPDLAPNVDTANHYDWNDSPNDTDPTPNLSNADFHGTSVAGVTAARGNNGLGVSGVAPRATLVGFRLISDYTTDAEDGEAMTRHNDIVQIKNNSWGHADGYPGYLYSPGTLLEAGRKDAVTNGRGGLGTIFVWSAGNGRLYGDQGNKDSYANSMYAINVGALSNAGNLASYSETGAHVTVVAPASGGTRKVVTTDLRGLDGYNDGVTSGELPDTNYTNDFGGTSAAAPVISGVVALILQANPALSWRDVKEILLRSSTKVFPSDAGWTIRSGGSSPSLPLIKHHHFYGGGLVNVQAAVELALGWSPLGPAQEVSRTQTFNSPTLNIPDNNTTGVDIPLDFTATQTLRVEHVTVAVNILHDYRGDLQVTLRSPGGVVSTLASKETEDDGTNYYNWTFSSMRHWGEAAKGTWVVSVKDLAASDTGYLTSATVTLHGSTIAPVQITSQTAQPQLLEAGQPLSLMGDTTGGGHVNHQWRRNGTTIVSSKNYQVASATPLYAGSYRFTADNLTGTATGDEALIGVVNRQVSPATVNEGATASLLANAAGPGMTFQWFKGTEPLANNGRIAGVTTSTLTITGATMVDNAEYFCRVVLGTTGLTMDTLPAAVTIRLKPVVAAPSSTNGVISGPVTYHFTADNGATKYTATGIPPGMTFSTKDGTFSGRPTRAGNYSVKISATNLAGVSPLFVFPWTVEPFPTLAIGTFSGLVDHNPDLNGGLGGRLRVAVAATGTISGTLTLAAKSYLLSGRIDALPGNADPSARITIARTKPLPPLILEFSVDLDTGALVGTVSDSTHTAGLTAKRTPWTATNKALNYAADYTAFLQATLDITDNPHGEGYATLKISTTGVATWAGKLADGTAITGGTTLGPDGTVPLHLMLYTNTGSVQGWSTITPAGSLLDGTLTWIKNPQPAKSTTRNYKAGITSQTLTLIGAKYTKPALNTPVISLPPPTTGVNNARLTFTSGGLTADLIQDLTITIANAVKMPAAANPKLVKLTLATTTGLINGSFTLKDLDPTDLASPFASVTRTGTYNGVLITRPGYNQGRGFFLLPMLPSAGPPKTTPYTSPILSGSAVLEVRP